MGTVDTPAAAFFAEARRRLPSFVPIDEAGFHDWRGEPGEPDLDYIRVAALANHLVERLSVAPQDDEVGAVCSLLEWSLRAARDPFRTLPVEGLIEDVQHAVLRSGGAVSMAAVRNMLGPASRDAWDELVVLWEGGRRRPLRRTSARRDSS